MQKCGLVEYAHNYGEIIMGAAFSMQFGRCIFRCGCFFDCLSYIRFFQYCVAITALGLSLLAGYYRSLIVDRRRLLNTLANLVEPYEVSNHALFGAPGINPLRKRHALAQVRRIGEGTLTYGSYRVGILGHRLYDAGGWILDQVGRDKQSLFLESGFLHNYCWGYAAFCE